MPIEFIHYASAEDIRGVRRLISCAPSTEGKAVEINKMGGRFEVRDLGFRRDSGARELRISCTHKGSVISRKTVPVAIYAVNDAVHEVIEAAYKAMIISDL